MFSSSSHSVRCLLASPPNEICFPIWNYPECYNVVRRFKYISTSQVLSTYESGVRMKWYRIIAGSQIRIKSRGIDWSACGCGRFSGPKYRTTYLVAFRTADGWTQLHGPMPNKLSAIFHCRKNKIEMLVMAILFFIFFLIRPVILCYLFGWTRAPIVDDANKEFLCQSGHISHFVWYVFFYYYIRFVLSRSRWILGAQMVL